jgi:ribosome biogenesis GTPase / thiamine phosphate phosphatase
MVFCQFESAFVSHCPQLLSGRALAEPTSWGAVCLRIPLIQQFGWNRFFADRFAPYACDDCVPARVTQQERGAWFAVSARGEVLLRHNRSDETPVTGDWLALRADLATIEAVLPRKNALSRKQAGRRTEEQVLATNVDVVLLVMGLDGDYNLRRLERYLALCAQSNVRAVVALNKSDVCADVQTRIEETRAIAAGVPVVSLSALSGAGLNGLASQVEPGETAALLGSSGAGKSTIVNRLLGYDAQPTQAVREGDSRGRHTTTSRELILLAQGWLLMDLPGLREIQPWADASEVSSIFPEIGALAAVCRFRNCRHESEPGCAVREAVDPARLESYRKLVREAEYLHRKADPQAQAELKARWKQIHKAMRNLPQKH